MIENLSENPKAEEKPTGKEEPYVDDGLIENPSENPEAEEKPTGKEESHVDDGLIENQSEIPEAEEKPTGKEEPHVDDGLIENLSEIPDAEVIENPSEVQTSKQDSMVAVEVNEIVNPPAEIQQTEVQWEEVVQGNVVRSPNEKSPEQSEGTQLKESEALNFLSGSETQKMDEVLDAKSTTELLAGEDIQHDGKANDEYTGEDGTDDVLAVQVQQTEDGNAAELNSKAPEMNELQEGVKNMIVDENYSKATDEESTDHEEQADDDELLGDEGELSEVDNEEDKLLETSSKPQLHLDDNSSSGDSRLYSKDGEGDKPVDSGMAQQSGEEGGDDAEVCRGSKFGRR